MSNRMVHSSIKFVFFFIPFFGALVGAFVANGAGVSAKTYLPNLVGLILGALALGLSEVFVSMAYKYRRTLSVLVIFFLSATFFSPGLEAVHRWIPIGPFQLNVSMALVPVILYLMWVQGITIALALGVMVSFIFILQPDAGQATAFSIGASVLFAFKRSMGGMQRFVGFGFFFSSAIFAWLRPDPLPAVDHVERILNLAWTQGVPIYFVAMLSVLLLHYPFFRAARALGEQKPLALSYLGYVFASFLVTQLGNFPVPVIGAGIATVLGWLFALVFISEATPDINK